MNKIKKFAPLAAAVAAVIALIMIFLPAVVLEFMDQKHTYSGLNVIFGYTEKESAMGITLKVEFFAFSFMNLLTYLLVIAGGVCGVLAFMKSDKPIFAWIAAACLALAGIFFFCSVGFTVLSKDIVDLGVTKENFKLGAGAVIGGIVSVLGALCAIAPTVLKALKK